MSKLYISANDFQHDCVRLARKVLDDSWQPQLILALWRGGAQPGVIMSEVFAYYGKPIAHAVVKCASYNGIMDRSNEVVFQDADALFDAIPSGLRVLVVDDVFDSGRTAEAVLQRLATADARTAMVYWKPMAAKVDLKPNYFVRETDMWIVFPHELMGLTPQEVKEKDPVLAEILGSPAPLE